MPGPPPTSTAAPAFRLVVEQFEDATWTGGTVYHQNLFRALSASKAEGLATALLYRSGQARSTDLADRYVEVPAAGPPPTRPRRLARRAVRTFRPAWAPPSPAAAALAALSADAVFTPAIYPAAMPTPVVGWIPDFQYVHLPDLVAPEQAAAARQYHADIAARSAVVVLSSGDALGDFGRAFPEHLDKARVVPFVSTLAGARFDLDPAAVAARYHLPERFVLLPNQFWKHKDHGTVVRALAALGDRLPGVAVVATGNTADHRDGAYFPSLLGEIATRGVHGRFRMLGLVPRADLFALCRQCLAILQPSRFEGWSTSIEEAKSIGKRVVASALPVHREQAPDALFFTPGDADRLADRLAEVWDTAAPGPDATREAAAAAALPGRMDAFARSFLAAARDAARRG